MLESIFKTCVPRDEVLGGNLSEDVFAAKLKQVVDGNAPLPNQPISIISTFGKPCL